MTVPLTWHQIDGFWLLSDHTYLMLRATGMPQIEALKTMCIVAAGAFVRQKLISSIEVEPR